MKRTIIICLMVLAIGGSALAQTNAGAAKAPLNQASVPAGDSIPKTHSHYSLAVGTGWSHYFSNFQTVSAKDVNKDFIGLSMRFLWEPEYLLSLGLETGFYRVYRVKKTLSPEYTMDSKEYIMPLMLVIRMKIIDHLYLSVAPGLVMQFSNISGIGSTVNTHQLSLANFEGCVSYLYPISKKWVVGGEARLLYVGVTNDYISSLNAVIAVIL